MVEFFERRTHQHIARVKRCLQVVARSSEHAELLLQRAELHDASKFGPEERIPYIWLTEFHRRRREGAVLEYPPGMEQRIKAAIAHHMSHNRHHPEFHADPNEMTEVDLIEMVCDWTAMSQEFGQCGGSARGWADKTVGVRVAFGQVQQQFIYAVIELLDRELANGESMGSITQ